MTVTFSGYYDGKEYRWNVFMDDVPMVPAGLYGERPHEKTGYQWGGRSKECRALSYDLLALVGGAVAGLDHHKLFCSSHVSEWPYHGPASFQDPHWRITDEQIADWLKWADLEQRSLRFAEGGEA